MKPTDQRYIVQLSSGDIRDFLDSGEFITVVENALDEAQGFARTHNEKCYVIIEVAP